MGTQCILMGNSEENFVLLQLTERLITLLIFTGLLGGRGRLYKGEGRGREGERERRHILYSYPLFSPPLSPFPVLPFVNLPFLLNVLLKLIVLRNSGE